MTFVPLFATLVHLVFGYSLGWSLNWASEGQVSIETTLLAYLLITLYNTLTKYYNLAYVMFYQPDKAYEIVKNLHDQFEKNKGDK